MSIVMTALQKKPELLKCTQQSLWNACIMAARTGFCLTVAKALSRRRPEADGKRIAEIAT